MDRPDFRDLVEGPDGLRWVGGSLMDEEQYRVEGWHRRLSYESGGKTIEIWEATREGLQEMGRIRRERKDVRRERYRRTVAEEDTFRDYVEGLLDQKGEVDG